MVIIKLDNDTVYTQRLKAYSPSEYPLTIQEQVIIKLYNELEEANEIITGLYEEMAGPDL